ncbi:MAG: type II secretion system protein [Candidatus Omnitrophica bacterium]|nr:type II secretion system protein [Candidatus Omnitrophota bacterium]
MLRYKIIKGRGFSLAEILISAVILVIVSAGFMASFIAANRFISRSKRHMAAVNLARQISEGLYDKVRADTWTNGVSNLLTCPPGTSNNNYIPPCIKTYALPDAAIGVPSIEPDNPLKNFSPSATLTIDLDGNKVTNPNCWQTCPRAVSVAINWNE